MSPIKDLESVSKADHKDKKAESQRDKGAQNTHHGRQQGQLAG